MHHALHPDHLFLKDDILLLFFILILSASPTSSMPSQWLGLVNLSSFSGPQALAPDPQLMMFRIMMPDDNWSWFLKQGLGLWLQFKYTGCANDSKCVTTKESAQRCKNKSKTMVAVQYISSQMLKRLEWERLGYRRIEGWWDYHRRGGTFIKIRKLTSSTNVEKKGNLRMWKASQHDRRPEPRPQSFFSSKLDFINS